MSWYSAVYVFSCLPKRHLPIQHLTGFVYECDFFSSVWKRFWMLPYSTEQLGICRKIVNLIENKQLWGAGLHYCCGLTDSEHVSHRTLFQEALKQERKIQINYTSFFKKLLRFSFWNIFLKCTGSRGSLGGRNPLRRLLSWLQRIFFFFFCIYMKQFSSVMLVMLPAIKVGQTGTGNTGWPSSITSVLLRCDINY